ncbi:MAG: IPT/TIG domain-containing protein [Methylotetracoccus sp.]
MHQASLINLFVAFLASASPDSQETTRTAHPHTGAAPVVSTARVDYDTRTITISGHDFGDGTPSVRLGGRRLELIEHRDELIIVQLPDAMRPSRYRLIVSSGTSSRHESRPFDMSIATLEPDPAF